MVEFSKIIKKVRRDERESLPEESSSSRSRRVPASGGTRKPPEPEHRSESRPEPSRGDLPVREPAQGGPLFLHEGEALIREDIPIKPVKPLFSQQRTREQIAAQTEASASAQAPVSRGDEEAVSSFQRHAKAGAPSARSSGDRANSLPRSEALALYDRMMDAIRSLLDQAREPSRIDTRHLTSLMGEVVSVIQSGDEQMTELAVIHILKEEESYLPQHCVNTAILALVIGQGGGYDVGKMMELGLTAFLHDIGMVSYTQAVSVRRPLTPREFESIKEHVKAGQEMLKQIYPALGEAVLSAQYEIHERMDASGYPAGRRLIHEYAKIIALADTFESMVHPRPFRSRYSIMEVFKEIFASKDKYDPAFIKVLVDRLGFFPNGSFIQLNTKEVGQVVAQNRRSPLRPIIRILFDEGGRRLYDDDIKDVSLMKYPTLHVVKCFLEEAPSVSPV